MPRCSAFGQDVGGVAEQADRERRVPPVCASRALRERVVEARRSSRRGSASRGAARCGAVHLDREHHAAVHRRGERLRAAHAAEAGGEDEPAPQRCRRSAGAPPRRTSRRCPAGCPACRCRSTSPAVIWPYIIRPLRSSSQKCSQVAQRRHQVGVGDQHPRRVLVGAEDADRLARLHQQRLVVLRARGARARWRRSTPSCARPCRCRRRPPGPRGARPPRGRGCS